MDCSHIQSSLPSEILEIVRNHTNISFLNHLSQTLLDPAHTKLFPQLEPLLPELCSRWLRNNNKSTVIAALGRIVPFQPSITEYVADFLQRKDLSWDIWDELSEDQLQELLLGLFRLTLHDPTVFSPFFGPEKLVYGLKHSSSRSLRYLTIRILCLYLGASDAALEHMISSYLGDSAIYGRWEDKNIDYRFLSLWEEKRERAVRSLLSQFRKTRKAHDSRKPTNHTPKGSRVLTNLDLIGSIELMGILIPSLPESRQSTNTTDAPLRHVLVPTNTTMENVRVVVEALLTPSPILLTGLPGSGKTSIVMCLAERLNKLDSMVTLHLNEQTDAKLLIGLYTSGNTPGTFTWKPGALTTAVREGRWVFVEDLDRAPNEIISTLLPLVERGELILPGRGDTIKAARGFKLIATMRASYNSHGDPRPPHPNMIGHRFWHRVPIQMLTDDELTEVVESKYPFLRHRSQSLLHVYSRARSLAQSQRVATEIKIGSARQLTPRDLLKWCNRIRDSFQKSKDFTEADWDNLFLEAVDCFAGFLPFGDFSESIISEIAQELQINSQRREHILLHHQISMTSGSEKSRLLRIGRATLSCETQKGIRRPSRYPFATSPHTLRLLERVASAVQYSEPLLLVGETGTGKTTCVQHLANLVGKKLVPFNLSQQSEGGDLIGGFKPVNIRSLILTIQDDFDELFHTSFSRKGNTQFSDLLGKSIAKGQWRRVCKLWHSAVTEVEKKMNSYKESQSSESRRQNKRQKLENPPKAEEDIQVLLGLEPRWTKLSMDIHDIESRVSAKPEAFALTFVEGSIVKALRNGDWILLDEINLASPDTLEALADVLGGDEGGGPSLLLTESGRLERIIAHPGFRVFAAMNPATDVGKKDLPLGIRSRFTEIFVESPDRDIKSLQSIVRSYISDKNLDNSIASDVTDLYLTVQKMAESNRIVDGAGQRPHFSLRTLTRTLNFSRDLSSLCNLRRGIYEGFHMSFLTFLDQASENALSPIIIHHLFGKHSNVTAELRKPLLQPSDGQNYVQHGHFWLRLGNFPVVDQPQYIITPFVQRNMNNLIRAIFSRRYPVLIQGPTSSGKTSMVEYLANISGNKFVRINNHEHTDLQEYLGSYVSDSDGQLRFQEGILVEALRNGYWIVLDELNLAPTDVLEALNRLLDDNRELFIPEIQEVIRPHENFMLFATQNPAGLYGGRKNLSRAFRNRFLELHFDDIPVEELCEILQRRTQIPESWSRRIVDAYKELSSFRQENRLFEQKSFATLRDLFRWALREAESVQQLAINGYMLLAERVRKPEERSRVKAVIEEVMSRRGPRVRINEQEIYSENTNREMALYQEKHDLSRGAVWTKSMKRLFVLVAQALRNNEPVLLVGETGCGKTTVCQMLAETFNKTLYVVNAHQNTETGDLIGSQRPIRNRASTGQELQESLLLAMKPHISPNSDLTVESLLELYDNLEPSVVENIPQAAKQEIRILRTRQSALFEWCDGSLVEAMKTGQFFLLDEISLADDSVLERLNSVLESQRTLLLAEKGARDSLVTAADDFQFLATMNPGGDYGKRELSPALRNRFTEIWVPSIHDTEDVLQIVQAKLAPSVQKFSETIVSFAHWFNSRYNTSAATSISIRDVLAWIEFVNIFCDENGLVATFHGAAMVFIDTIGANPAALLSIPPAAVLQERRHCVEELSRLLGVNCSSLYFQVPEIKVTKTSIAFGDFSLSLVAPSGPQSDFTFEAPTTRCNAMRISRALQLSKPILIEGNPGVGKTTLVTAIAKALGKRIVRINLSEQTDLMDLFGSDIPVEGAHAGIFAWRDAPFLTAMKRGYWVLLDEMNLASQSILEGLNSCLDHRGEAYVAELNQTFKRHPDFRLFAAQNPHHQGGGRKGLPASFVNRFTVVYADTFRPEDLIVICKRLFPSVPLDDIRTLTSFVSQLESNATGNNRLGTHGGPWEFNLRDTIRYLQLMTSTEGLLPAAKAYDISDIIFRRRFRSPSDRQFVDQLFSTVFDSQAGNRNFFHILTQTSYQVGLGYSDRTKFGSQATIPRAALSNTHWPILEAVLICIGQNWPVVLVGSPGSGKTTLLQHLAAVKGANLVTMPMNADIDSMDLVGGYEQADPSQNIPALASALKKFLRSELIYELAHGLDSGQYTTNLESWLIDIRTDNIEEHSLAKIYDHLSALLEIIDREDSRYDYILDQRKTTRHLQELQRQSEPSSARFEWIDGLLIRAMERGDWLVLDNANLCSSSVLDRLNSLLEPNGSLIINEHPTENGGARLVHPHPNFRIFFTMDPRNGELSRAMRNRAIELFVPIEGQSGNFNISTPFALESTVSRFRTVVESFNIPDVEDSVPTLDAELAVDHLSPHDVSLIPRFQEQLSSGLVESNTFNAVKTMLDSFDLLLNAQNHELSRKTEEILASRSTAVLNLSSIHPLNNETLTQYTAESFMSFQSLADMRDLIMRTAGFGAQVNQIATVQVPSRQQRRVNAGTAQFLGESISALMAAVKSISQSGEFPSQGFFAHVQKIQDFWQEILHRTFQETHDYTGVRICFLLFHEFLIQTYGEGGNGFVIEQSRILDQLSPQKYLSSGQSMEMIWDAFRPVTPPDRQRLEVLLQFESLADQFDNLIWTAQIPINQVIRIRSSFTLAIELIKSPTFAEDSTTLIAALEGSLEEIKSEKSRYRSALQPFFRSEFEEVCRIFDLYSAAGNIPTEEFSNGLLEASLLAQRPTKRNSLYGKQLVYGSENQNVLSHLTRYVGTFDTFLSGSNPGNTLGFALSKKIFLVSTVKLRELNLLRSELALLGHFVSCGSKILCLENIHLLDSVLEKLFHGIHSFCHDGPIFDKFLLPTRAYLESGSTSSPEESSLAWCQFSIAAMLLYVPNIPLDPLLKRHVEQTIQWNRFKNFKDKEMAIETFERRFTGEESNIRSRLIHQKLSDMGIVRKPKNDVGQRPKVSQMDELQTEFDHILGLIGTVGSRIKEGIRLSDASTIKNIQQLTARLRSRYRGYDDITEPLIGFLNCLHIGLSISNQITAGQKSNRTKESSLLWHLKECEQDSLVPERRSSMQHLGELRRFAIRHAVLGCDESGSDLVHIRFAFKELYDQWKRNLEVEQRQHAKNSSLYAFQGEDNEDEETIEQEFGKMFPDYENEACHDDSDPTRLQSPRDIAIRACSLHSQLFSNPQEPHNAMLEYVNDVGSDDMLAQDLGMNFKFEAALPPIYAGLQKVLDSITSKAPENKLYNIYTHSNTYEANRLISLVFQIQHRFRELQKAWPEHATLEDVLQISEDILGFKYIEPVIKFLTKSEKLHEAINKWQRVASKEYSAANLYDELTDLLVSWRRLELSTWAKLFEIEIDRCVEDAQSWWFVAYESIIAVPESLVNAGQSLRPHAKELLRTLEDFFRTTSLGQYVSRLRLLTQLQLDLELRAKELPGLATIHAALVNFLSYYRRFECSVRETLSKRRQALEKDVRDVVQLASWKDTNIVALRQSAKTSHRKLFKSVRKFRELLRMPVSELISHGPPDVFTGSLSSFNPHACSLQYFNIFDDSFSPEISTKYIPDWTEIPSRFKKVSATVKLMLKISQPDQSSVDGAKVLNKFIIYIEKSTEELRKATPSTLTAENSASVKHLKTRKRALFAEVLKALRQMGLQYNLSKDVLAKQDGLPTILSMLPCPIPEERSSSIRDAEYHFHKTLGMLSRIRDLVREHSGDLTPAEVNRSAGYLEALLHQVIRQRTVIMNIYPQVLSLQNCIRTLEELPKTTESFTALAPSDGFRFQFTKIRQSITWLVPISKTFSSIISAQSQLGKFDAESITMDLNSWADKFGEQLGVFNTLPILPAHLVSHKHQDLVESSVELLHSFKRNISSWIEQQPVCDQVLLQLIPFAEVDLNTPNGTILQDEKGIKDFCQEVFNFTDLVLSSVQDLEQALVSFPKSDEEPSWLIKEENYRLAQLETFHVRLLNTTLSTLLVDLARLPPGNLQRGCILIVSVLPILKQHSNIFSGAIDKYLNLHGSVCKFLHRLARSFLEIGTNGFCYPSEKSAETERGDDKLEEGTGLGDGEGAEDISKDIGDDEDLTELAEQPSEQRKDEIEDEKDAVDMADAGLEGETGEVVEDKDDGSTQSDSEEGNEDIEEETGEVDDLGPSAVDEKMWDDGEKVDKDKSGDQGKGTKQDEQVAADKNENRDGEDEADELEAIQEEPEAVGQEPMEKTDPNLQQGENLDLPEEMNLDGNDLIDSGDESLGDNSMSDGLGDLDEDESKEEIGNDGYEREEAQISEGEDANDDRVDHPEIGEQADGEENEEDAVAQIPDEPEAGEANEGSLADPPEEGLQDTEETQQTQDNIENGNDAPNTDIIGAGLDAEDQLENRPNTAGASEQDRGSARPNAGENTGLSKDEAPADETESKDAIGRTDDARNSEDATSFKKLGDVLEQWYNSYRQIQQAKEPDTDQPRQVPKDDEMADADFEHLPTEESQADAQALATASEEQARALDADKGVSASEQENSSTFLDESETENEDTEMKDVRTEATSHQEYDSKPNAFIGDPNTAANERQSGQFESSAVSDVEDVDLHLSNIQIAPDEDVALLPSENARQLWTKHELGTRALAATLAEQLRLILAPTLATKLRGDFRTGKRLNIKRIIPYIASSYRRDKIWMRRSIPSKRSYQIMIALDDSKSMSDDEGGPKRKDDLAFETLALISKSLAVLEAGELCVLGFGEDVRVAHPFDKPFTDEAGAEVFRSFSFSQQKTDVRNLVSQATLLFQSARAGATGPTASLWQLLLVISDGVCEDHDGINRLVRRAQEDRIMIVFIVVDRSNGSDGKTTAQSIMDLQTAEFAKDDGGEMKLLRRKYMDTFPFRWWLVVRDVGELPNVLAAALRQWFTEVVDAEG